MATFFGEVLSVYSRAVEDYEDDFEEDEDIRKELEEKRELHLQWSPDVEQTLSSEGGVLQCSHLIVAAGDNATGFLAAYVLSAEGWGVVGGASLWTERTGPSARPVCVFHRRVDQPSVLVCQITGYIAEDQQFQWTEKVFSCLQAGGLGVTVLSDCPAALHKAPDALGGSAPPFLRMLQTGGPAPPGPPQGRAVCPPLEQPNMVTGLPAAVLAHCQVHRVPAVAYQCFSDVISPDSITMETYKAALASCCSLIKLDPSPSTEVLRKFVKASEIQSNLYI